MHVGKAGLQVTIVTVSHTHSLARVGRVLSSLGKTQGTSPMTGTKER